MKSIMIAALLSTAPLAAAAEEFSWSGAYVGASVGTFGSDFSFSEDYIDSTGDDVTAYGAFIGVREQFANNLVGGVELSYITSEEMDFDSLGSMDTEFANVEFQLGYAMDVVLPYVGVGYAKAWGQDGVSLSAGLDVAITDHVIAGMKYTAVTKDVDYDDIRIEADVDVISARLAYKF